MRLPSFPLLGKELVEMAARRRTYVVRVLYAALLFGFFALFAASYFRTGSGMYGVLGRGRQMFEVLIALQFFGIFIFLPAMMSGSITYEKERDSLALLFLTDLKPWEILLQKYIGGLVPMLSFLLLSMPLAAIAYAFGGVSMEYLAFGFVALIAACLQVGAFAILCSAFFRTTAAAFLASYLLGAAFYCALPLGGALIRAATNHRVYWNDDVTLALFPPMIMGGGNDGAIERSLRLIPVLASTAVFLGLARFFLVRRAFAPAGNPLLALFRRLDAIMQRANRLTGNVMLARGEARMPEDDPVAWRELTKRSLGRPNHLFRILVALELPVVALCLLAHANSYSGTAVLVFILWGIAFLVLVVQAANTIVSERVNQTLEVLLTSPLSGADIVRQKWRALRRLAIVLAIPLLTVNVARSLEYRYSLLCGILAVVVYLPLIAWGSLYIGLRSRTRFRAILTALGVGIGWCFVPLLVAIASDAFSIHNQDLEFALLAGPATIVIANEFGELGSVGFDDAILTNLANFAFYAAALLITRWRCLASADHYLRR